MKDFIPISRRIFGHWIYDDSEYFKVWVTMIARARWSEEPSRQIYKGILYTLNRGEFIFGRPTWAAELGISENRLRTLLNKLIEEKMIIVTKKHSKFTVLKIANYEKFNQQNNQEDNQQNNQEDNQQNNHVGDESYQGFDDFDNQQNNQQNDQQNNQENNLKTTSKTPADHQQNTNKEEYKEREESKKDNKLYIVQNVKPKRQRNTIDKGEFDKLWDKYPSKVGRQTAIKKSKMLLEKYGFEVLERCIERYKQYVDKIRATGFNQQYQNGSTFFNSGYEDYLADDWVMPPVGKVNGKSSSTFNDSCSSRDYTKDQLDDMEKKLLGWE